MCQYMQKKVDIPPDIVYTRCVTITVYSGGLPMITHYTTAAAALQRWSRAKRLQAIIADLLGSQAMRDCGREVYMQHCKACGYVHITPSRTCKHRLCPTCQLRRSRRLAYNARAVVAALAQREGVPPYRLALVTLTQRNVAPRPSALRYEIDHLQDALSRLRHVRTARRDILGSVRTVEVTYNPDADTWHPHVHLLIIGRKDSPVLTTQWWRDAWAALRNLDYAPQVDCQIVTRDDAVFEVSKYISKLDTLVKRCPERLRAARMRELDDALSGRVLVVYTGLWREIRRELKSDDESDNTLPHHNPECLGQIEDALMRWTGSEYVQDYP